MKPSILVVGSSNTDMVIKADHLPSPGETILGGTFLMNPGGKGANQAVAAARLGGSVTFICKTGNDIFGKQSVQLFEDEGIDVSHLLSDSKNPSGVALITVDKNAENCIVVASGANASLSVADLQQSDAVIKNAEIVLMQLEIPLETVAYVAEIAAASGKKVVLNPAPACKLPESLYRHISIITPNQNEAQLLTGIAVTDVDGAKLAAAVLHEKGVKDVIITLGKAGALVYSKSNYTYIAAEKVIPVDTTAAGDVFNGALAVAISEGKSIEDATVFACKASGIAVTRLGAQSSAPYRNEISSKVHHADI
ncbi:ribokinase [Pedobacter frigiditerrae]|uniref:Ribokinase n=1 Tax=Pedobacter frigiditerrae TaxID=2530452 RepID=A0A4V2MI26_9SPHI|nr:ribokinase [Pedobacter frigiditerrae]TCC88726.1 ribokinase [Pedobacter frigiditerrae]